MEINLKKNKQLQNKNYPYVSIKHDEIFSNILKKIDDKCFNDASRKAYLFIERIKFLENEYDEVLGERFSICKENAFEIIIDKQTLFKSSQFISKYFIQKYLGSQLAGYTAVYDLIPVDYFKGNFKIIKLKTTENFLDECYEMVIFCLENELTINSKEADELYKINHKI